MLEIIILIIAGLILVVGVVLLIVLLKRKPQPQVEQKLDLKEIGALSNQIENLSKEMKMDIELAVSKEMTKTSEQSNKASEANNEKLERFQKNITESLNHRFDALNEQIINRLNDINKKVDEKCKGTYKIELSRQKNVKWLILILVICAFTGLCTPIKDVPYTYLIKTSEGNTTQNISEHLPLILAKNENMMISLTAVFGILIFSRAKIRLSDFFMLVGLVFLSFFSQRQTSMLIIIGNFILVRLLCGVLANIKKLMKMDKDIPQEWLFIKNFTMFAIIVGVSTITVFNIYQKSDDPFIDETDYPVQASEYINNTLIPEVGKQNLRLYNEYNYGSYLLYQNIPVFIDSRADLYTPEFNGKKGKDGKYVGKDVFSDFLDISNLSTPYEEKFEEYEITHVMTYRNSKLNTLLEKDSNYSLIYGDDYFKIYEREI